MLPPPISLLCLAATLVFAGFAPAEAQTVSKSYSAFTISGDTLDEIQRQLDLRGPAVGAAGKRHPGATRMQFSTRVEYARTAKACRVASAQVTVKAHVTLPRWTSRRAASADVALIWDTLSADIKRHEESHVVIARNHARDLRSALLALPPARDCERQKEAVAATSERVLAEHDAAQDRFDRIEGRNFQARLARLLEYRLERLSRPGG